MKHLKIHSLAAIVATALMAFLGAGTAAAESTELFSGGSTASSGAATKYSLFSGTFLIFSNTSGEVITTCNGTIETKTTNTTGTSVSGNISTLDWTTCTFPTTTLSNGSLSIASKAGTNDGTVTGTGSKMTIEAFGLFDCVYGTGAGTHLGTLDGVTAGNARLPVNAAIILQEPKFGCPETAKWVANYTVTSPTALNVGV
jgi:hypothetical protein